jgi:hypothetical protein
MPLVPWDVKNRMAVVRIDRARKGARTPAVGAGAPILGHALPAHLLDGPPLGHVLQIASAGDIVRKKVGAAGTLATVFGSQRRSPECRVAILAVGNGRVDEAPRVESEPEVVAKCDHLPRRSSHVNEVRSLVPASGIVGLILVLRGHRVLLDADLAELYGVPTKRLNEQVKRNQRRFPEDFAFQLTREEKDKVVAGCDRLARLKFSPALPWAFTEHGALMAASVLNSERAVEVSVAVVRAFVRLREMLASHVELARKLAALERKYDAQFKVVFEAIRELMKPLEPKRRKIGFLAADEDTG